MQLRKSTGLVGHWKFNEKSGITANDSSRYRNTGTLTGATHLPKWGEKGIIFDGVDDYISAGNNANLNMTTSVTIAGWFNIQDAAGNDRLIGKSTSWLSGWTSIAYDLGLTSSNVKWRIGDGTSVNPTINEVVFAAVMGWQYIVAKYDGSTTSIYKNGILQQSKSVSISILTTVFDLKMSEAANPFTGSIDEVRIYNRALSTLEIKRLYNSTKHKYI